MTAMQPTEGMVLKLSIFAKCVVGGKDRLRVVESSSVVGKLEPASLEQQLICDRLLRVS
jgi:hypothetical protein